MLNAVVPEGKLNAAKKHTTEILLFLSVRPLKYTTEVFSYFKCIVYIFIFGLVMFIKCLWYKLKVSKWFGDFCYLCRACFLSEQLVSDFGPNSLELNTL